MSELARKLAQTLIDVGRALPSQILGSSESEILQVEQHYNLKLPEAYKNFLRVMGNGAGSFQTDATWQCQYLEDIRNSVLLALDPATHEVVNFALSDQMFVFLESGGSQFLFFYLNAGNDPPVFLYEAPDKDARQIADSFNAWIQMCIDTVIATQKRMTQASP